MISGSGIVRVLRYPDFRLMWIGAFVSFTGSWISNIARGYFVFELTGSESKLALVSFSNSIPVLFFAFLAGTLTDRLDKRKTLIWAQLLLGIASLYLGIAIWLHFIQYWQLVVTALFTGIVSCIEMPTRQSIVGRVVPPEELATAVPVNAMTFNVARIFGPALGGAILAIMGVALCYIIDGLSFIALIWAVKAIKADLSPASDHGPQPVKDLIFEGMRYTFRDRRLTALFLLETCTAAFGLAYLPLLPAYVDQVLGATGDATKSMLGYCYTVVGVGALIGLLGVTHLAHTEKKGTIIRACMWTIGLGLVVLSFARTPLVAFPVLACMGAATVSQFNTTNALFQLLSPDRLRGRVLAMHIWALQGLSPFGVLFFGWVANVTRLNGIITFDGSKYRLLSTGIPLVMQMGGALVLVGAIAAVFTRRGLSDLNEIVR